MAADHKAVPTRIAQIAITAHDLARAVEFYRDVLGIEFLFEIPGAAFFRIGDLRLMVAVPEGEFDHPASILYYGVDDITLAHERLSARGVVFEREPHLIAKMPDYELWMAFFRDSESNMLALMAEVRD
jgi:methylmalonyl-CoA/ethylmalonyl-CoA epimerase